MGSPLLCTGKERSRKKRISTISKNKNMYVNLNGVAGD